jgi:hypothetical protein
MSTAPFSGGEEEYMTAIHRVTSALAATSLLFAGSTTIHGDDLGSAVNQQLAAARAATVQYHDLNQALADGYTDLGLNPFEDTIEFVNFGLVNCAPDVLQPAGLSYVPSGNGLRLVGVEYSFPMACGAPPEDFLPGVGEWEPEAGVPVWTLRVPLWSGNSVGSH